MNLISKTKHIREVIDDDEDILLCGGITPRIPNNGSRWASLVSLGSYSTWERVLSRPTDWVGVGVGPKVGPEALN